MNQYFLKDQKIIKRKFAIDKNYDFNFKELKKNNNQLTFPLLLYLKKN